MHQISKYCVKEQCLNNDVPDLAKINSCLGTSLAQIFLEYSHDEKKRLLGVLPLLTYPRKSVSIPSNSVCCNNVSSTTSRNEIIKADIHRNILEIGQNLLEKFRIKIEESAQESVKRKLQEKFFIYQAEKRREVELTTQELHVKYENYIKTVQNELEEKLEVQLTNAIAKSTKEMQKAVVRERINVTREMLQKMRTEIRYIVKSLYEDFEKSFRAQRENIIADFNEIMRREHVKLNENMNECKRQAAKDLCIQKHDFEMQHTVDIIYILCSERSRSRAEKHAIHKYFEKQISSFQDGLVRLNETMDIMRQEIIESQAARQLLEEQIYEITKEFQKFVNFAFHAVPGQAEYALPVELSRLLASDKEEKKNEASNEV